MGIKPVLDSLDGVGEGIRGLYEKRDDGRFHLALDGDVPGFVPKAKLDEFRTNNTELLKERDALKGTVERFRDLDPDKAREALAKLADFDRRKLVDAGEYEKALAEAKTAMAADRESAVAAVRQELESERDKAVKLNDRLFELTVEHGIRDIWIKPELGLVPTAVRDALDAARLVFRMKDGKPVPHGANGNVLYGGKGDPMSFREWIESELPNRPHWQMKSNGAGGAGNPAGGGHKGEDLMKLPPEQRMNLARRAA